MYLSAENYMWETLKENEEISNKINELIGIKESFGRVKQIKWDLFYWRKANHIHKWFVDNCQNGEDECHSCDVSFSDLKELLKLCEEVMANKEKASEILPNTTGFFFGGTEYDEYYFSWTEVTIIALKRILKLETMFEEKGMNITYRSSW